MNDDELIIQLLEEILGDHKSYYEHKGQLSFNCHWCDDGRDKGNLEINIHRGIYKCWSCSEVNGTHGPLLKLINILGTKRQIKYYHLLRPEDGEKYSNRNKVIKKIALPKEYISIFDMNPKNPNHLTALRYIRDRGITDNILRKYNIGLCDSGNFKNRIVIPSYNVNNELNYFIARSWISRTKLKYLNPEVPKDTIIFNESLINWDDDIFLCEGVFDSLFIDNSIPLLGKMVSEKLFNRLYDDAKKNVIICLDGDAFSNAEKLYHELNGGKLYNRIKMIRLPKDKDVADLKGNVFDYYYEIK